MPAPYRKVAAGRGFAWILEGLQRTRAQPMPYLQLCLWLGLLAAMPVVNFVFVFLGGVFLQAGLVSALNTQARGEGMRRGQFFDGLRQPGAFLRLLPIAAVKIAFTFIVLSMVADALGPDLIKIVQGGTPGALTPAQTVVVEQAAGRLLRAIFVLAPGAILVNWLVMLALPQAMLGGVGGLAALGRALAAMFGNLGAMLANLVLSTAIMIGVGLLLTIPAAMLLALAGPGSVLAGLVQAALFIGLGALTFGLDGIVMWGAWRDIFATDETAPITGNGTGPAITQIEA